MGLAAVVTNQLAQLEAYPDVAGIIYARNGPTTHFGPRVFE